MWVEKERYCMGKKGQTWRIILRSCVYPCSVKPTMSVEREKIVDTYITCIRGLRYNDILWEEMSTKVHRIC